MSADGQINKDSTGCNLFAYCCNNVIILIDPNGTCPYDGTVADFHRLEQGLPSLHCTCIDLTEKLDAFMEQNAKTFKEYDETHNDLWVAVYFYKNVKNGGEWDIKLQDDWKFEADKKYIYRGKELRFDDPGNINYGYVGAVVFSETVLVFLVGAYSIRCNGFKLGDLSTFYDDSRDNGMIKYGYSLYRSNLL